MSINLYHADYEHQEYERRIQVHLAKRALRKTRKEETKTMATLVVRSFRLPVSLVTTTWRWGESVVQRTGWTMHVFGKRSI